MTFPSSLSLVSIQRGLWTTLGHVGISRLQPCYAQQAETLLGQATSLRLHMCSPFNWLLPTEPKGGMGSRGSPGVIHIACPLRDFQGPEWGEQEYRAPPVGLSCLSLPTPIKPEVQQDCASPFPIPPIHILSNPDLRTQLAEKECAFSAPTFRVLGGRSPVPSVLDWRKQRNSGRLDPRPYLFNKTEI